MLVYRFYHACGKGINSEKGHKLDNQAEILFGLSKLTQLLLLRSCDPVSFYMYDQLLSMSDFSKFHVQEGALKFRD